MSNHDDLDPFASDKNIQVSFVRHISEMQSYDLIVLPGSKHVSSDLLWLNTHGFSEKIHHHLRYKGKVLGICGGLQMLGEHIITNNIEGDDCRGLGLLPITTTMQNEKILKQIRQTSNIPEGLLVTGYEIHHGNSNGDEELFPFTAHSRDKQVWGTYIHGLFNQGQFRQAWLHHLGFQTYDSINQDLHTLHSLDLIADHLERCIQPKILQHLLQSTQTNHT